MSGADATRQARRPLWLRAMASTEGGLILAILASLVLIYFLEPNHAFFGAANIRRLSHNSALFGILAVGAALVIITGGIDLSVGSIVAFCGVFSVLMATQWLPGGHSGRGPLPLWIVGVTLVSTLAVGAVIGLLHALMINKISLPPFIATLATMAALRSAASILSRDKNWNIGSPTFRALGSDIRFSVPIFLVVAITASLVMGVTVLGRHFFALGGNEKAARLCGLRVERLKTLAYLASGVLAALAGLMFAGNTGVADNRAGASYELFAITAAVVGGCSLSGGLGTIRGTVLGLILIRIVIQGTGLVVRGVSPTQIEGLVLGIVVVLAVGYNQRFRLKS